MAPAEILTSVEVNVRALVERDFETAGFRQSECDFFIEQHELVV